MVIPQRPTSVTLANAREPRELPFFSPLASSSLRQLAGVSGRGPVWHPREAKTQEGAKRMPMDGWATGGSRGAGVRSSVEGTGSRSSHPGRWAFTDAFTFPTHLGLGPCPQACLCRLSLLISLFRHQKCPD
jgi:hypothetical protein